MGSAARQLSRPGDPKRLKFLTNNFVSPHLPQEDQVAPRIKAFYGTSENAVKTPDLSIYVLVAIARKRLGLAASLYQTL
jgi:hypothetical protein